MLLVKNPHGFGPLLGGDLGGDGWEEGAGGGSASESCVTANEARTAERSMSAGLNGPSHQSAGVVPEI